MNHIGNFSSKVESLEEHIILMGFSLTIISFVNIDFFIS